MDKVLSDVETRVLACLFEKEVTTPDYYPLTLNSLTAACNQKSNRNPVVSYDEAAVELGLERLRSKGIVQMIHIAGSRAAKYRHAFLEEYKLVPPEAAVLCELMLRGPQTLGEIRGHAERMYGFSDLSEVEEILRELMDREPSLVDKLPRQPGRKEARFMSLLSGRPEIREEDAALSPEAMNSDRDRISALEEEVSGLRNELGSLRKIFEEFRSQF